MFNERLPACLAHSDAKSRRKWQKIAKLMVRHGAWDDSIIERECGWGSLSDSADLIMLERPMLFGPKDYVPAYDLFCETLDSIAFEEYGSRDKDDRLRVRNFLKSCIEQNLDQLWFCLGLMRSFSLPQVTGEESPEYKLDLAVLRAHLFFWDWYCDNQTRFYTGIRRLFVLEGMDPDSDEGRRQHGQFWGHVPRGLFARIGKTPDEINALSEVFPEQAGIIMRQWMKEFDERQA